MKNREAKVKNKIIASLANPNLTISNPAARIQILPGLTEHFLFISIKPNFLTLKETSRELITYSFRSYRCCFRSGKLIRTRTDPQP